MAGYRILKDGELYIDGLPGPEYAKIALSNYSSQQTEPCKLEIIDIDGNVMSTVTVGPGDTIAPGKEPPDEQEKPKKKTTKKAGGRKKKGD